MLRDKNPSCIVHIMRVKRGLKRGMPDGYLCEQNIKEIGTKRSTATGNQSYIHILTLCFFID